MPYRRLPKTDQARIRALKSAVDSSVQNGIFTNVLSHNTYHRAKDFLQRFSAEVDIYKRCAQEQSSKRGNADYEAALKKARMYVSHFIQVLSMCIIRGEVARSKRPYYGLPEDEDTSRLVSEVVKYVRKNISVRTSVEDMAASMFVSRTHLAAKFKAESGMTLSEFILKEKVKEAKRLLKYTDKGLCAIGEYLGFSSQSHFTRVFKKYSGKTPSEYRNENNS